MSDRLSAAGFEQVKITAAIGALNRAPQRVKAFARGRIAARSR